MDSLKAHLANVHGVKFEHIQKSFPSSQLFEEWKASVENEQFFNLVARSSEQVNGKGEKFRSLMCNRSGQYRSNKGHGATQRSHPQKGCTSKLGRPCTCSVKVRSYPSGEVHVDGCLTHYGHSMEVAHSRVPAMERDKLAEKLKTGVSVSRVIHDVNETAPVDLTRHWSCGAETKIRNRLEIISDRSTGTRKRRLLSATE